MQAAAPVRTSARAVNETLFVNKTGILSHSQFYGERKMLWFNEPPIKDWVWAAVADLERLGACCFWYALLGVTRDQAAFELAVNEGLMQTDAGLSEGVTYAQAVYIINQARMRITVYQVDVTVASELCLIRRSQPAGREDPRGVVLVPVNDQFERCAHWLPTVRFRRVPISVPPAMALLINPMIGLNADVEDLQPVIEPFIGPQHINGLAEEFVNYQDSRLPLEDEGPGFDLNIFEAPEYPDVGAVQSQPVQDGLSLLRKVSRIVGVIPPTFPLAHRMSPLAAVFHRIPEAGIPSLDAGDMMIVEGFPTAMQRGLTRMMGEGMMAWQLRPSVLADMHVSSRHLVYVCLSPPSLIDPKFLESGDYNPDFVGRLVTETGTFVLVDPFDVPFSGHQSSYTTLRVFRLTRAGVTISGAVFRAMPFHLEKVISVTTTALHVVLVRNKRECFPTQRAFVRAQFSVLAMAAPEELRPLITDQRNEALSLIAEGKLADDFDPVRLVLALHEQLQGMRRLMAVSGRAFHSA